MKATSIILFAFSVFPVVSIIGNGYHPLVIDGKQWHEKSNTEIVDYDFYYTISGDTVIGGENYKKLYFSYTISPRYEEGGQHSDTPTTYSSTEWAWLQEYKGKVYLLNKYGHKSVLYDFNLHVGDTAFEDDYCVQQVTKTDTILVNNMRLKRLWLTETSKRNGITYVGYWVEGIGCNYGLENAHGWEGNSSIQMKECVEDGNVIFISDDFRTSEGDVKCATPTIAYDNSRLVFSCETPGAECVYEIKCTDTGSGRGREATLSRTYEIRVHATLEGWQDSDVTTATIGWRNGRPVMEGFSSVTMDGGEGIGDVNGDGKVDVADIAIIIDQMAGK